MADLDGEVEASAALQTLADLHAVVRFQDDGVVRVAVVHPDDPDDRVLVLIDDPDLTAAEALAFAARRLVESMTALSRRKHLHVVACATS